MKNLYESLLDDEDDILDSTSNEIADDWFKENTRGNYKIKVFKIGQHKGNIKIKGDMIIKGYTGEQFPGCLNIEKSTGNVIIEKCPNLTSLTGLFVDGGSCKNFSVNNCPKLISLEGGPRYVDETFTCSGNSSLTSLEYAPYLTDRVYIMKNGKKFKFNEISKKINSMYIFCNQETSEEDLINEEYINETLNEPHLLKLAAQLKKYNIKDYKELPITFKTVLGSRVCNSSGLAQPILWDEMDSTNVIELNSDDVHAQKLINQMISKKIHALLLMQNAEGEYKCITDGNYYMELPCSVNTKNLTDKFDEYAEFKDKPIKKSELKQYLGFGRCIFLIDWVNLNTYGIRSKRAAAQKGMIIQGDPEYYKQVAADNMKRYRDIIKKNRSAHKDKLYIKTSENIKNIIERWLKLTIHVILHPEILATSDYEFSEIATDMGDQMASLGSGRNAYKYQTPGLLNMFSKVCTIYARLLNKLSNIYSDDEQTLQNYINNIEKIMSRVDNRLKKFGF